jgi:hypothetical protein
LRQSDAWTVAAARALLYNGTHSKSKEKHYMAYITAQQTRAIKADLVRTFPEFKFSVRNEHSSSIRVVLLSGPVRFDLTDEAQRMRVHGLPSDCAESVVSRPMKNHSINNYHTQNYQNADILDAMLEIINYGNHDNSDIMTDYFDVGWYVTLESGTWEKPYVLITKGVK